MPHFLCRVTDSLGAESSLTMEAEDPAAAIEDLLRQDRHVLSLVQTDFAIEPPGADVLHDRVSLFAHGLAEMLRLGLPLPAAIRTLAHEADSRRFQTELQDVAAKVEKGQPLSDALRLHPGRFSRLFTALIAAGEKTGRLPDLLPLLVRHLNLRCAMRQRLFEALLYPVVAFCVIVTLMLLMRNVLMEPMRLGYSLGWRTLPTPEPVLLAFFMIRNLPVVLLGLMGGLLALSGLARLPGRGGEPFRHLWDWTSYRLPILGAFQRSAFVSVTCHSLGILLRGGVPVDDALELTAEMSDSAPGRSALIVARDRCRSGIPLPEALEDPEWFPPTLGWILSTGESRGRMIEALTEAAGFFEQDAEFRLVLIRTFFPSAAIVLVAALVVLPGLLSIFVPLFGISLGSF